MNPMFLNQLVQQMMGGVSSVPQNRPMTRQDLTSFLERDPRLSQQYTPTINALLNSMHGRRDVSFSEMKNDNAVADKIYSDHGRPEWSQWLRPPEEITPNDRVKAGFSDFSKHYLWSGDNREALEKFKKDNEIPPLPKPDPRGSTFSERLPPAFRPPGYAGEIPAGLMMMMLGYPVRPDQDMVYDPEMIRNVIETPKTKDRA